MTIYIILAINIYINKYLHNYIYGFGTPRDAATTVLEAFKGSRNGVPTYLLHTLTEHPHNNDCYHGETERPRLAVSDRALVE